MHAIQTSRVITLMDHTDAGVRWDLLQTLNLRMQLIKFAMVRNSTYSKPESLFPLLISVSLQVSAQIMDIL